MTDDPHLLVTREDAILIATLNRPDKLNAISVQMMKTFSEAIERFRDSPDLKVLLIKARGRYFSAGADLQEGTRERPRRTLLDTGSEIRKIHRHLPSDMRRIWDEMEAIEKPFVVAHQGICLGAGLEMSLSCDFRLAAQSAAYGFPEGKFGVLPATNGISRLTRIVGTHWARYLVMANLRADAQKAFHMGLVHEVFPDASFEEDVMKFCRHLAEQNAEQMGTAKLAIELARDLGAAQAASVERLANSALMLMPSYRELIQKHVAGIGKGDKT